MLLYRYLHATHTLLMLPLCSILCYLIYSHNTFMLLILPYATMLISHANFIHFMLIFMLISIQFHVLSCLISCYSCYLLCYFLCYFILNFMLLMLPPYVNSHANFILIMLLHTISMLMLISHTTLHVAAFPMLLPMLLPHVTSMLLSC
jgi:hypothetical protein